MANMGFGQQAGRGDLVRRLSSGGDPNSIRLPEQGPVAQGGQPAQGGGDPTSLLSLISKIVGQNQENQSAYKEGQDIDPSKIQQMLQALQQMKGQ